MDFVYEVKGQKVTLSADPDAVAVRFKEPAPHSMRAAVALREALGSFSARKEIPGESYTIVPVAPTPEDRATRLQSAMNRLDAAPEVVRVTPVFKVDDKQVVATERIIVGVKDGVANAEEVANSEGGEIVEQFEGTLEFVVRLEETQDPLEVSTRLSARPDVEYAEPDFVTIGHHLARRPAPPVVPLAKDGGLTFRPNGVSPLDVGSDPLLQQQYAVFITEADQAWALQVGDPNVHIAILDEGVDTSHEDLETAVVSGFDAIDMDTFQEPNSWDGHGTSCAGLAAAIPGNGLGIRGIGAGCTVYAVRIAQSNFPGGPWATSPGVIRRAIDWSWMNGADVLSNSWSAAPSNAVATGFDNARSLGRDGLGCIVVAAAGNSNNAVVFPANRPGLLAVAASNEFDEPKTPFSADGEDWWGSCFGPEVALAAPGVHNLTTDITDEGGYNPNPGGNYTDFNGTSSATPLVAGAAALVLSANPALTEAQVRQILVSTADKVGSFPYFQGRNDRMGQGRLNVKRAVQSA